MVTERNHVRTCQRQIFLNRDGSGGELVQLGLKSFKQLAAARDFLVGELGVLGELQAEFLELILQFAAQFLNSRMFLTFKFHS